MCSFLITVITKIRPIHPRCFYTLTFQSLLSKETDTEIFVVLEKFCNNNEYLTLVFTAG